MLGIVQTTMDRADHHAVIGHLVAQAEHRVVAPAVHRQRHAHPHRLLALTQGGRKGGDGKVSFFRNHLILKGGPDGGDGGNGGNIKGF